MSTIQITNAALDGALTLDQLIEELQAAKASGLATGQELVCLGTAFMTQCAPVYTMALMPTLDGDLAIGLSSEDEMTWGIALSAAGKDNFEFVSPAEASSVDPFEIARRLGMDKRLAQMENEQLGQTASAAAPAKKPKPL